MGVQFLSSLKAKYLYFTRYDRFLVTTLCLFNGKITPLPYLPSKEPLYVAVNINETFFLFFRESMLIQHPK